MTREQLYLLRELVDLTSLGVLLAGLVALALAIIV